MKKVFAIVLLLAVLALPTRLSAQALSTMNSTPPTSFPDFVTSCFINYYTTGGVQEKLYLVTDKPFYSAGDTIYFRAFLVNSIYFNQATDSKFINVELVDAMGNVASRIRVMGSEGRFYNAMPLSTRMTAGRYTLRAYSKWQTNFDKALLYSREIEIGNYIDDAVSTNIRYSFDGTGRVMATVEVINSRFNPIPDNRVEYSLSIDGRTTRHVTKTDNNGIFRFSFRPSKNMTDCIRMNINANGRKLDRKLQLPSFEDDFSAKFLPEGGNLIAGLNQVVAFKVVGVDGHAVEATGVVQTQMGVEVGRIQTEHDGMGKFLLNARMGETYIAVLTTKNGVSRTFTLPTAQPSGCVVNLIPEEGNRALLQVSTTPDYPRQQLVAIVQSRGIVNYVVEDLSHPLRIPLEKLRSGVAQVSIVNKVSRKVVAQRLFFVRGKVAKADIVSSVKKFAPREKVWLDFTVRNSAGDAVKGDFVVSVTDADLLKQDKNTDNIFSYMLLNSELKGHIENPTYYFEADDAVRNIHLDLVMLTHGWRRYSINSILAGKKPVIKYPFEKEQCIAGGIKVTAGKNRSTSVMIFRNRTEFLGIHDLNSANRFFITGVDSPDTATYILQAFNRNGNSDRVHIKVDPYVYPTTPIIPREVIDNTKVATSLTEEYMMRSKHTYFEDGGMPIVDIDAVEIIAKRVQNYEYSSSLNDFNTVSGDMTRFVSIFDALQRFRQLEVVGNEVYLATSKRSNSSIVRASQERSSAGDSGDGDGDGSGGSDITDIEIDMGSDDKIDLMPAVYINGQLMDMGVIDAYPMSEVLSVSYLDKFESMAAGMSSETGAIIIHVKDINARERYISNSKVEVMVPGYAPPMEFYSPDYSVNNDKSKRDNRTTIAWVPSLQTNSMGDASISFWTADRQSDYRVVIEGITADGELLHNEMMLISK